jgi:hypothetical protein
MDSNAAEYLLRLAFFRPAAACSQHSECMLFAGWRCVLYVHSALLRKPFIDLDLY